MNKHIETEILSLSSNEWYEYLSQFDDASIYQTIEFANYSKGGKNLEQLVLKINGEVSAVTLIRIIEIPVVRRGIAYVRWAPLWQKKNKIIDINIFNSALDALYNEYVIKRKFVLRILSGHLVEEEEKYISIFNEKGFSNFKMSDKTVILDISKDEEILRANLRKKWRYSLKQAEKSELVIDQNDDDNSFDVFLEIYKSMHERKQFKEFIDVELFKFINAALPKGKKMQVFICKKNNQPLSAMVVSHMGNSGIYLLGGSNSDGLKYSASYLLQWEVIKWLKSQNIKYYNLGGIDPVNGKGVYTFKTGLGGDEVNYIGGFEVSKDFLSKSILKLISKLKK